MSQEASRQEEDQDHHPTAEQPGVVESPGKLLSHERAGAILLIEDEAELNRALSIRLINEGYSVITAYDCMHGLDRYLYQRPDLVLLDLSLPRLNGLRMLGRLRETPGMDLAPILVITRESDAEFEAESSAQGVVKVLEKPVSQHQIVSEVNRILAA